MKIIHKIVFRVSAILILLCITLTAINSSGQISKVSAVSGSSATINPNASQECKNIMNYLKECEYANRCVFGAFNYTDYTRSAALKAEYNYEQIESTYGVSPALASFFYSPASDPDVVKKINDRIEEYHNRGIMVVVQPGFSQVYNKYKDMANSSDPALRKKYEDVDFDCITAQYDATNPDRNMEIYNDRFQDLVYLGDALEDLQNRGISVICRMIVEPNNPTFHNFYSRTEEGQEHFRNFFRQMVDYLIKERGLNNFLVAWCPAGNGGSVDGYWPGEDYVDIVSPTIYPNGQYDSSGSVRNLSEMYYEELLKYGKVFGYSEYGVSNSATEPGDWGIAADALIQRFKKATWVNTWTLENGFFFPTNINAEKFVYSDHLVTLDKLPKLSSDVVYPEPGYIAAFSQKGYKGNYSGLSPGKFSATALKNIGINLSNIKSLRITRGYQITLYKGSDCTGDSLKLITDSYDVSRYNIGEYKSLSVEKITLDNIALNKPSISSDTDSNTSLINDGTLDYWETAKGVNSWVIIDLQDVYSIASYEIKHISSYGEVSSSNAVDYRLQYSLDGKKWKDADLVYGNSVAAVTRNIEQVDAQYIRLYIENPNSTSLAGDEDRAAICELSVYGSKIRAGQKTDWTLIPTVVKDPSEQIVNHVTNTVVRDGGNYDGNIVGDEIVPGETDDAATNSVVKKIKKVIKSMAPQGSNLWLWISIAAAGVVLAGGIVTFFVIKSKKK